MLNIILAIVLIANILFQNFSTLYVEVGLRCEIKENSGNCSESLQKGYPSFISQIFKLQQFLIYYVNIYPRSCLILYYSISSIYNCITKNSDIR
jgi:hypothetical protein